MNHSAAYTRLLVPQCFVGMTTQTRQALLDGSIKKSTLADLVKRMDAASCQLGNAGRAAAPVARNAPPKPRKFFNSSMFNGPKSAPKPAAAAAPRSGGGHSLNRLFAPSMFAAPRKNANSRPAVPHSLNKFFAMPAGAVLAPRPAAVANAAPRPSATTKSAGGGGKQNAYAKAVGTKEAPGTMAKELLQAINTPWPAADELARDMRALATTAAQAGALNSGNSMTAAQRKTYNALAKKTVKALPKYKQLTKLQARMAKLGMANRNSVTFGKWTAAIQKQFDSAPAHIADALNPPKPRRGGNNNNNNSLKNWLNNSENSNNYRKDMGAVRKMFGKKMTGGLSNGSLDEYVKNYHRFLDQGRAEAAEDMLYSIEVMERMAGVSVNSEQSTTMKLKKQAAKAFRNGSLKRYLDKYTDLMARGNFDEADDALYSIQVMERMAGVPMTLENSTALKFRKQALNEDVSAGIITPKKYEKLLANLTAR